MCNERESVMTENNMEAILKLIEGCLDYLHDTDIDLEEVRVTMIADLSTAKGIAFAEWEVE